MPALCLLALVCFSWADDAEDEESLAIAFDIATVG
jgi:hypothetical protein